MEKVFCSHCERFIGHLAPSDEVCPSCSRPLGLLDEEFLPTMPDGEPADLRAAFQFPAGRWGSDVPRWRDFTGLDDDDVVMRAARVCAAAGETQEAARRLQQQAWELCRISRSLREQAAAVATACSGEQPAPGAADIPAGPPAVRTAVRDEREVPLWERAARACETAQLAVDAVRISRKDRQCLQEESSLTLGPASLLTPPHYHLPPLEHSSLLLSAREADTAEEPANLPILERPERRVASSTTLYAWGYAPPESHLCRHQCEATAAAAQYAIGEGWEPGRPGAWAREVCLGLSLSEMLRWVVPILHDDPGVAGWGLCMRRGV